MRTKILIVLGAVLSLLSCTHSERQICMTATADQTFAQAISEEDFRANLPKAKDGDIRAMNIVISYYLENEMNDEANLWSNKREVAIAKSGVESPR